ncbi:MAG: phage tail tape measure protein [Faecalitalea cylindroides]
MASKNLKGITLQIGGDTTELSKALKKPDKDISDLQSKLKSVNQMLKFDPSNTELLAQKQRLLKEQITATEDKLKLLKETQKQFVTEGGNVDSKQYIALEQEIQKAESALKRLNSETSNVSANMQAFGEKAKQVGDKFTSVGKEVSKASAVAVGAGVASYKAWSEVDDALDSVAAGTGATGKELENLQQTAKDVYTSMPVDIKATGQAVADINTRLGLQGDALEEATRQFMKYSEVNSSDVSTSIETVAKAMSDANIPTSELNSVLDELTSASQASGLTVDALAETLSQNGVQMRALGFNTQETIALLATMEKNGVNSSVVLTGMKKAMANYTNAGKDANVELGNLFQGIQDGTVSASDAMDVFGTKAGASLYQYIQEGKLNYQDLLKVLQDSNGQLDASYEAMLDPMDQAKVAMNNLKQVGADLFDQIQATLAPMIQALAENLQRFSQWFSTLDPNVQQFIVIVGLVVAALGPVLIFIGQICTGVGKIIEIVGFLGEFLAPVFSAIGSGLSALWGLILANPVIAIVVGIIAVIALLWTKCEWFRNGVTNLINNIRDGFKNGWNEIKNIWTNAIDGIKNKFSSMIKETKEWGSDFIEGFKQGILGRIKSLFSAITSIPKKIRRLLHFSRPDEGPLRDYETWMPDMMDGLSKGIRENSYKVEDEMKSLASKMNVNAYSKASIAQTLSANSSTVIHLNVVSELDGRQVSKVVSQSITRSANSRLAFKGA